MANREKRWGLSIDESGQLDKSDDPVAIAGLLIDEDEVGPAARGLQKALERELPEFPWPLHAMLINEPSYVALSGARWATAQSTRDPGERGRVAEEAGAWLSAHHGGATGRVLERLEGKRKPAHADLSSLSRALRREQGGLTRLLEARSRHAWDLVRSTAEQIAAAGHGADVYTNQQFPRRDP